MKHEKPDSRTLRIGRRDFTAAGILALLSGVAISVTGCGGGGSGSPSGPSTPAASGDKSGTVSANHGHTAVITAAQLQAGGAVALNIRGSSDHPHTLSLTAAQVASIAGGTRVTQTSSSDDGHSHDVTFN
ncbi:MAG: hypothetical protein AB7O37_09580 [Vicinamibacteria bacterium]